MTVREAARAAAVVVSAGWWVVLVMLWPTDARPFIGGSQTNNIWDLILGYNGFGRLTGDEVGRVGGGPGPFSAGAGWLRPPRSCNEAGRCWTAQSVCAAG